MRLTTKERDAKESRRGPDEDGWITVESRGARRRLKEDLPQGDVLDKYKLKYTLVCTLTK